MNYAVIESWYCHYCHYIVMKLLRHAEICNYMYDDIPNVPGVF